jgi:hypothetical protein
VTSAAQELLVQKRFRECRQTAQCIIKIREIGTYGK